jgi:hypothetical protein
VGIMSAFTLSIKLSIKHEIFRVFDMFLPLKSVSTDSGRKDTSDSGRKGSAKNASQISGQKSIMDGVELNIDLQVTHLISGAR